MQELVLYSMLRVVEDMLQGILHSVYLAYVEFDLITLISVIISGIMLLYTTTLRFLEYIYWDYKPVRERQTISLTERCPPVCNGFPCVTDKCYDCIRIRWETFRSIRNEDKKDKLEMCRRSDGTVRANEKDLTLDNIWSSAD